MTGSPVNRGELRRSPSRGDRSVGGKTVIASVELSDEAHPPRDATDIFVWHSPWRLPHDGSIWKAKAEARGNFPGYTHLLDAVENAIVHLTPNVLSVDGKQTAFAIPTSAIQRVVLESRSDQDGLSVLSIDYVDSRADIRRLWLRIGRRLPGILDRRHGHLADRLGDAGVAASQFERIVPGFSRMRVSDDAWDLPAETPLWDANVTVSLASGDFTARLAVRNDVVELAHGHCRLIIAHHEISGVSFADPRHDSTDGVLFLAFKDGDVLLDLKLSLACDPGASRSRACEMAHVFRQRGIPVRLAGEWLNRFETPSDDAEMTAPREVNGVAQPDSTIGALTNATSSTRANPSSSEHPEKPWELTVHPSRHRGHRPENASSDEFLDQLREQVIDEFRLGRSLHDENLLTEREFEEYRARLVAEAGAVYQLRRVHLLHEWNLITDEEYSDNRRDSINMLRTWGQAQHGG